ncbi:hypothetical protein HH214_06950 [Mucilaginibacter robiniae]|uniref:Tetratricopeptide repeat protein n=1 Tax=Mucilaginibacter robiniae TaxID=2728022 RepID=A0A7L5DZU1_9SPHI|nr:hypothetical protein [Mucilaginibacter robiniae]QJD95627.1 hypothetical protein HH214_06950 [Mucilaginibacter robiniae]
MSVLNSSYSTLKSYIKHLLAGSLLLILASCSLQNKSAINRNLQNLTAHYNILFNANELLRQKQEIYAASFIDAYDRILPVYQDTIARGEGTVTDKELDAVVVKANTIIANKEQSHYVGDAYLLLAKSAYLYGNYYNATEFCSYVVRSYPQQTDLLQEARSWQIRSLLYLQLLPQAGHVLDTAMLDVTPKSKNAALIYAAGLQYYINIREYPQAEELALKAIAATHQTLQRRRWTFILAQLQELNGKPAEAYNSYTHIVNSNAAFEMAFNADIDRIRIEDNQNGRHLSRADRLRSLLRNENNREFTDQIYYQLAELDLSNNKVDDAIKNYHLSIKNSLKNQTQKGLTYLRLADISFKNKADYVQAKNYYDSTLLNLPPNYPGYATIRKKADNLQLLADRLHLIAHEDTLQALATLNETDRNKRIEEIVQLKLQQQTAGANSNNPFTNTGNVQLQGNGAPAGTPTANGNSTNSTFYFYNTAAISQGFNDFKRKWGNRRLEDNWRRSVRSNSDQTINTLNTTQNVAPSVLPADLQKNATQVAADNYRQSLLQSIPLTPAQKIQSDLRVYNAYLDIANFYRDVLNDKPEAIRIYELLLGRFPDDPNRPAIYYNLYRLYADAQPGKADEYKKILLDKYASTPFAKVITDPDYARHLDDQDTELNALYNQVYDLYAHRQYAQVITRSDELLKMYPTSKLAAQIAYLRALAAGHNEKLQPFKDELLQLTTKYPNDRLITPLVVQHLNYINDNQAEMATRSVVLVDTDPDTMPFIPAPVIQKSTKQQLAAAQPQAKPAAPVKATPATTPAVAKTAPAPTSTPTPQPVEPPSIFNLRDSTNYFFVINVSTGTVNLSSSRFGVGQFNRTNYQGANIQHQLKPVGENNQMIYVGRFSSLNDAKFYARTIVPLLPQIMKVPAAQYSFFIVTQANLDKITDRKTLDSYIDYYQKHY